MFSVSRDRMIADMKTLLFLILFAFPALAGPAPHEASYVIEPVSTAGGAAGVVYARGAMSYAARKTCGVWKTETVFSTDVGYEMSGVRTTHWKQTTTETEDGCLFDFEVFTRGDGKDRKDLAGSARCENGMKKMKIIHPAVMFYDFPLSVRFPMEQTAALLKAAGRGEKSMNVRFYDGTLPVSSSAVSARLSPVSGKAPFPALKGLKSVRVDLAFYPREKGDGAPSYEVSFRLYENGVVDETVQNFGTHALRSSLSSLTLLPDIPCDGK